MLLNYFAKIDGETVVLLFSSLLCLYVIVPFQVAWVLTGQMYKILM